MTIKEYEAAKSIQETLNIARMPYVEDVFIYKLQELIEEFECDFYE